MTEQFNSNDILRYWAKVQKGETDQCWNWTAGCRKGYGTFRHRGKHKFAHRIAWKLANGDITGGLCVLHSCDNPKCCNPAHLFLGTNLDNSRDRDQKGRNKPQKGEKHGQHKLTAAQVKEIRRRYAAGGITQKKLAEEMGVIHQHISRIINGKQWQIEYGALDPHD